MVGERRRRAVAIIRRHLMPLLILLVLLTLTGCSVLFPNGLFPTYYSIAYDVALKDCEARKDRMEKFYPPTLDCEKQAKLDARYLAATTDGGGAYPMTCLSTPTSTGTVTSCY
jgi:hypothetical protein